MWKKSSPYLRKIIYLNSIFIPFYFGWFEFLRYIFSMDFNLLFARCKFQVWHGCEKKWFTTNACEKCVQVHTNKNAKFIFDSRKVDSNNLLRGRFWHDILKCYSIVAFDISVFTILRCARERQLFYMHIGTSTYICMHIRSFSVCKQLSIVIVSWLNATIYQKLLLKFPVQVNI